APSPLSLSLLSLSGIPSPLPDDPFSLRTLSSHQLHTSRGLLSGTTSLLPPSRIRQARTSLLSLLLFPHTHGPTRLLLCTTLPPLPPAPPLASRPAHTPSCLLSLFLSGYSALLPLLLLSHRCT